MAKTILLIDDDRDFVSMVKLILETNGYGVHTAANAAEAEAVLDKGVRPDGMILDIMMSGRGEGMIFARKMRKNAAYKDIPILMLTGMRSATGFGPIKDDPRDLFFLPVDIYLEKPVLPETLLKKVEEMLAGRKS
jgi:DNA-binding response OmpR family regulator